MKKAVVLLLLPMMLLVVSCTGDTSQTPVIVDSTEPLAIVGSTDLQVCVDMPYEMVLNCTYEAAEWGVAYNSLPDGLKFSEKSHTLSGIANTIGEVGYLGVEVSNNGETIADEYKVEVLSFTSVTGIMDVNGMKAGRSGEGYLRIHNGDGIKSQRIIVTTEPIDIPDERGFVTVDIPLRQRLYQDDIDNITSLVSELDTDDLQVESYEDGTVKVCGFTQLQSRIIEIQYVAETLFTVSYETVNVDVSDLISISESRFYMSPHDTKNVKVTLDIPKDYIFEKDQFKFATVTGETVATEHGVIISIALKTIWKVSVEN